MLDIIKKVFRDLGPYLVTLVAVSLLVVVLAVIITFVDLKSIGVKIDNDGYVTAMLTLSGVGIYFTALMYQVKEYKLQVIELRKSVEAQTNSSLALDEQRKLLMEQNSNSLIFRVIENFHEFKNRNNLPNFISTTVKDYSTSFVKELIEIEKLQNLDKKEFNKEFVRSIYDIFSSIKSSENYYEYRSFVQFSYNIFDMIDEHKKDESSKFRAIFLNQLSVDEEMLLYMSTLVFDDLHPSDSLKWNVPVTKMVLARIKKLSYFSVNFNSVDEKMIMEEFRKYSERS